MVLGQEVCGGRQGWEGRYEGGLLHAQWRSPSEPLWTAEGWPVLGDDVCGVGTSCVGEESPQILLGDLSDHLWLELFPSGSFACARVISIEVSADCLEVAGARW